MNFGITMIDFFLKYVSVVSLILMGLFLLDLTNTDKEDLYIVEQTEIQSSMSLDGDELDDDEDSAFVLNDPSDGFQSRCDFCAFTSLEEQHENMCSAALRLGQVRRYAPRKNLADSHIHIITKNMKDGAGFGSDHLFLFHNSFIIN